MQLIVYHKAPHGKVSQQCWYAVHNRSHQVAVLAFIGSHHRYIGFLTHMQNVAFGKYLRRACTTDALADTFGVHNLLLGAHTSEPRAQHHY